MKQRERMDRVTRLTSLWLDGCTSREELRELNDLLRGEPEACEVHLDLVEAHGHLAHEHAGEDVTADLPELLRFSPPHASGSSAPGPFRGWTGRRWWGPLAAAAAVALLANAIVLWNLRPLGSDAGETELAAGDGVAVLSRLVNPEWASETGRHAEGDALSPGSFHLRSGLAQIEFFSGAAVIVEGPAELRLEDAWRLECRSGRLRASVPEPARGFTIVTPDYEAVDLGTEFALSVGEDGRSELHVVDGEVRLDDGDGRELRRLLAGHGVRAPGGTRFESVTGGGRDFVDHRSLLERAQADWRSRFEAWRTSRERLETDPDTRLLFDFEGQAPWNRTLENRSASGPDGAIVGAQWTQGRWPGKGALEFKRITDRVRLHLPGEFEALTLSTWVRIEGFDRWLSSLLLTDGHEPGEVHWQISDEGELILGIGDAKPLNTFSPAVIHPSDLGRWMHLAATVDRSTRRVMHYLDGEIVGEQILESLPTLRFGPCEIGNWRCEGRGQANSIRSLNGRLDEFLVLERALSPAEIRDLHHTGAPRG